MIRRSLFLLGSVLMLLSCSDTLDRTSDDIIATVGNQKLTLSEALENIPAHVLEQDSLSALVSYSEQWVESRVTVDHAERIRIDRMDEFQKKLNRSRDQLLESFLKSYILQEHADELEVTEEEAKNYFQEHRDRFVLDEKYVRYRHLTTQTQAEADRANRELMGGGEWETIVQEYSVNPELQLRESTQFFPISIAAQQFSTLNQYLRVIGIGERSPIYFDGQHYHFVQLMEEKPEGDHPDFEWLIPNIEEWLKLEKARRITNAYIRNLYLEAQANNEIDLASVTDIEEILKDLNY